MATVFIELGGLRKRTGVCLGDRLQLLDHATNIFFSHSREDRKGKDFLVDLFRLRAVARLVAKTIDIIRVLVNWLIMDIDADSPLAKLFECIVPRESGGMPVPPNDKKMVGVLDSRPCFKWTDVFDRFEKRPVKTSDVISAACKSL
jgi:hypothetical protein